MTPPNDHALTRRTLLRAAGVAGAGALGAGTAAGVSPEGCQGGGGVAPPPGPPALYRDQPGAPQFENGEDWSADPLRVCGTDAYVDGEYLFQDFIYDDNGANTTATGSSPNPAPDSHLFGPMSGDVVYPTGEDYVNNAADLLEFRTRLTDDDRVHYRFTLTSMRRTDAAAIAVGIDRTGADAGDDDWGYGIGSLGDLGLDHVLVTWGEGAELDGEALPDDAVEVDLERNQVDVRLPLAPEGETWRHYLVTGLWDGDGAFKPIRDQPTADQPGGAQGRSPPPVFNVGFRYDAQEPVATPNVDTGTPEQQAEEAIDETTASRGIGYGHWRDHAQSKALIDRDISDFHADIDFGAIAEGATRTPAEPVTGYHNRIYASDYTLDDGDHPSAGIGPYVTESGDDNNGEDIIRGNLVPYALYVPDSYDGSPNPFHVHLHSLSGTYNQYRSWTPNFIRQVGEERGRIVMTTTGRGPGVPYDDQAELDVFEAWRDVRNTYSIDANRVTIGGYSMGGIGTHRLASKWPGLFARAFSIAGSLGGEFSDTAAGDDLYRNQERLDINQRHVPLLMWQGPADELAPLPLVLKYSQRVNELGLRHEFDLFPAADHLSFGYLDEWEPAAEFLTGATVERTPQRVTYRSVPRTHNDSLDLEHDGAYWVSDIGVAGDAEAGLVDARSLGFGEADPVVSRYRREGTEPKPHIKRGIDWASALSAPRARNELAVTLEAVDEVTLRLEAAAIDPTQELTLSVESTTDAEITLASGRGSLTVSVPAGESTRTVRVCGTAAGPPRLDVTRSDDARVFTGGGTDRVDVSVSASKPVRLRDRVPDGWTVVAGDGTERTVDGATYVEFEPAADGTFTYFVEAPSGAGGTGRDTFGPVEVRSHDGWEPVDGTTETNVVLGPDASL